jgi:hypothetical protein
LERYVAWYDKFLMPGRVEPQSGKPEH